MATLVRPFEWLIAGPYAFGEHLEVSHVTKVEPTILAAVRSDAPLRGPLWKAPPLERAYTEFGLLDLRRIFGETQRALVYAVTTFEASQAGEATLFLSVDDHCIAWLNGSKVGQVTTSLPATINSTRRKVSVKKGENRLLIKLSQRRGYWEFMARVMPRTKGLVVRGLPAARSDGMME